MRSYAALSIFACLAGLTLAAGCSSNPPGYGQQVAPHPVNDCDMQMPGYPGCTEAPYGVAGDYYPAYGDAYYPGSGVVLVPEPVPVPVTPPATAPSTPPVHHPAPPPPKHHRLPIKTCHPQPGRPCP